MMRPSDQQTMSETDDIGAAIRAAAATVSAPMSLRERVVADQQRGRVRRRRRFGLLAAAGTVAAALIVALVLTLPGGGAGTPVEQATALALAEPTGPAPGPMAGTNRLDAVVGDVAFPDWSSRHGWKAVGQRTGKVDGRTAKTVFYEDAAGRRVGYTIVSGEPLDVPDGGRQVTVDGTDVTLLRKKDAAIAMWEVRGHTCLLATTGDVTGGDLANLASWSGYTT